VINATTQGKVLDGRPHIMSALGADTTFSILALASEPPAFIGQCLLGTWRLLEVFRYTGNHTQSLC